MLQFVDVSLRRGSRLLFGHASVQIHPGDKIGITGANGVGKSSLFALLLGEIHCDGGELLLPAHWRLAHVAQQLAGGAQPALEFVIDGDRDLRELQRQLASAERHDEGGRVGELHAQLEAIGGYSAPSRAARLLHGLGFASADLQRPVSAFSGGWRMRLNLAQALMCRSDLLLLDEPTNHLDLDAIIWLESWLRSYPGTLLLISHDREFLDRVAAQILHLEHQSVTLYSGNYSAFERLRRERLAGQQADYRKQQREIAHVQSYIDRFRAKASKAKQAQSRLKALRRMQEIAPAHVDSPFHFRLREPARLPQQLLRLEHAGAGYGDSRVLDNIRLSLSPGDRIGLLGRNGAGKSTLIKLLAGALAPITGDYAPARDLNIGYFAQHQVEQLDPDSSALEHLQRLDRLAREQDLRDYLGGFGFSGDAAQMPTGPFSGGEKSRLALALLVYAKPNLLLLDEPTNHLDLEMRQALAQALQEFSGAMVLVSHDRHLLQVCCDELWLVHDQCVEAFPLSLEEYPQWLAAQNRQADDAQTPQSPQRAVARKQQKREQAEQRKRQQPLRNAISRAERALERAESERARLEQQLADSGLYSADNKLRLQTLLLEKSQLDSRCRALESEWLEASEKLESMQVPD